jgi:hypothetical protein
VDPENRGRVTGRLAAIEAAGWKCRVLVTCRAANFADGYIPWRKLVTYELAPLKPSAIGKLIGRWYGGEDERGKGLREVIAGSYSLQHACRSPLLAALACVAHEERPLKGDATRRDLYQRVVDSVLRRRWKGSDQEAAGNLNVDDLKILLRPAAWRLFASSPAVNQFSNERVIDAIAETNQGGRVAMGAAAIRDRLVKSGLLVSAGKNKRGDEQLSFMHRTMLEYLVGEHLGRVVKKSGWEGAAAEWAEGQRVHVSLLVEKKGWLPEWREALVLLGGALGEVGLVTRFIGLLIGEKDDLYGHRLCLAAVSLAEQPDQIRKKLHDRVDEITHRGYELYWGHLRNETENVVKHFLPGWQSVGKLNGRIAGGQVLVAALVHTLLGEASATMRRHAAEALGMLGELPDGQDTAAALVQAMLSDSDNKVRQHAAAALGILGKSATRPEVMAARIRAQLDPLDTSYRIDAASTLGCLGEEVVRQDVVAALVQAHTPMLAVEVHDAPTAIALLDVRHRKRRDLRPPQRAAEEHGDDGAVPQPLQRRDVRRVQ